MLVYRNTKFVQTQGKNIAAKFLYIFINNLAFLPLIMKTNCILKSCLFLFSYLICKCLATIVNEGRQDYRREIYSEKNEGPVFNRLERIQTHQMNKVTDNVEFLPNGNLKMLIKQRLDSPTLSSNFLVTDGKIEVDIKAAKGRGVVTSFYLQSQDKDEIDVVEILGGMPHFTQSNFFIKGNTTSFDRGETHYLGVPLNDGFHRYGVERRQNNIYWTADGLILRTLNDNHPQGFPRSPVEVRLSVWAGGDHGNLQGTIDWAGGPTDYSELPFSMELRNLYVEDYNTGYKRAYKNSFEDLFSVAAKSQGATFTRENCKFSVK